MGKIKRQNRFRVKEVEGEGQVNKENSIKWKRCEINQMKIRRRAHETDRGKSRKHG